MLRERVTSAAVLIGVLVVVLVLGEPWIAAAIALIVVAAAIEAFRLLRAAGYPSYPYFGAAVGVACVVVAAAPTAAGPNAIPEAVGLLVAAVAIVLAGVLAFREADPRQGFAAWMATSFGGLYVGSLAFVVRLGTVVAPVPGSAPAAGLGAERAWIVALVLTVWVYDTAAYFVGSRYGRRKFLAHVSPSKSYAGLAGGLAGAVVLGVAAGWALGVALPLAAIFGLVVGLAAQAGDLAESMLKRAAGAKDSGTLIPGHGGVLDRVDSFLFAAPLATLYAAFLFR